MDSEQRRAPAVERHGANHFRSPWPRRLAVALTLLALLLAIYGNTFEVPFLLDDDVNLLDNPGIRSLTAREAWVPDPALGFGGRPVLNLSHAANYALGGLSVRGYHATNLAIFWVAALACYGVVRRTLTGRVLRDSWGHDAWWLALAVPALWLAHPLATSAVNYLTQRAELLVGCFGFSALYCFVRGVSASSRWPWFVGAVACCLAGAMSKEVAIVVPFLIWTYDRTFFAGTFAAALRHRWRVHVPLFATCLWVVHSTHDLGARGAGFEVGYTWWSYALIECRAVVTYLRLALWPDPLVFDYGRVAADSMAVTLGYAAVLSGLIAAGFLAFLRRPAAGYLVVWFFAVLAPTSSVIPVAGAPIAEYRAFLIVPAVMCGLVLLLLRVLRGRAGVGVFVVVLLGGLQTWVRNHDFRSDLALWSDTVAKAPANARAWTNLGHALQKRRDLAGAGEAFARARELDPRNAQAQANFAGWLVALGKPAEAIAPYHEALRLQPRRANYWRGLGHAHFSLGQLEPAGQAYTQALALAPRLPASHHNLGCWFAAQGRFREARAEFEAALQLAPDFSEARTALGRLPPPATPAP